jgi:hypothetical protein
MQNERPLDEIPADFRLPAGIFTTADLTPEDLPDPADVQPDHPGARLLGWAAGRGGRIAVFGLLLLVGSGLVLLEVMFRPAAITHVSEIPGIHAAIGMTAALAVVLLARVGQWLLLRRDANPMPPRTAPSRALPVRPATPAPAAPGTLRPTIAPTAGGGAR